MATIRFLSAADVKAALPMAAAIEGMKAAFAQLAEGKAVMPLRARTQVAEQGTTLAMPAFLADSEALAVKVVSVFPGNVRRGEPTIYALVLLLAAETGRPLALLEGGSLTAIRTGAGAGAATDLLARADARTAGILGSGVQARTQLEAICTVRPIEAVRVYSPNAEHAAQFAAEMAGQGPIPDDVKAVTSPQRAVSEADIICAATTSNTAVFSDKDLKPGVHINGVGSFASHMQEIPAATVARALVIVDERDACMAEAGDLLQPIADGLITADHIHADLGEIVTGQQPGRTSPEQITFFKSVGVAIQDAAAARITLTRAEEADLGQEIDW